MLIYDIQTHFDAVHGIVLSALRQGLTAVYDPQVVTSVDGKYTKGCIMIITTELQESNSTTPIKTFLRHGGRMDHDICCKKSTQQTEHYCYTNQWKVGKEPRKEGNSF